MQQADKPQHVTLRAGDTLIVLAGKRGERARLLYAGPDLPGASPDDLERLAARQHAPGGPQVPITHSFLNCIGTGHPSPPGLLAHSGGQHWALDPRVGKVSMEDARRCVITTSDPASGLTIHHAIELFEESGVAQFQTRIENETDSPLSLEWCSAICLPLAPHMARVTSFVGRWANEFQTEQHDLVRGAFLRENRSGRTSHDCFPGLYLGTPSTSEEYGDAVAVHLGWSGNHRLRVDRLADGNVSLQAGELLLPGEVVIEPGGSYDTPQLFACWSAQGYGDVTRRIHRFVRAEILGTAKARPVHYNTWEAVYFDHSPQKLFELAEQAARVGAERFVLDDGWFGARRSDKAGLGDWFVSEDVYSDGLKPLADHVRALGMEFGLWFEPEMVNPDSEIYRANPDWVLQVAGAEPIASRHQLPLDLTRSEVCDYLLERITTLVHELGISYIKWDMNRDIQHPGGTDGRAFIHLQTRALYALIEQIRAACPDLVIESCSSGGARADYAILRRTDRIWTSDNNDARARYAIMRGASRFLPLEVLGNHVGPQRCHITGRRFDMAFRAGTAVFGHMGIELDLALESDGDRAVLAAAITLHKRHRKLIHEGALHRLQSPAHINAIGCVATDQAEAIYQVAILDQHPATQPPCLRFAGLDRGTRYRIELVWPQKLASDIGSFAGSALIDYGIQLPLTYPDTCLIYHLKAEP